jgi:hypothetical protein
VVLVDLDSVHEFEGNDEVGTAGFRMHRLAAPGDALSDFAMMPMGWKANWNMKGVFQNVPTSLVKGGVRIELPSWEEVWPVVRDGEFVLFRFDGRHWLRSGDPIVLAGRMLTPRAVVPGTDTQAVTTPIYDRIFRTGEARVDRPELDGEFNPRAAERRERKREREAKLLRKDFRSSGGKAKPNQERVDPTKLRARPAR